MKRTTLAIALFVTLVPAVNAMAQAPVLERMDKVQKALPDGPVALVDGKAVTRGDFLFLYHSQCMGLVASGRELTDDMRVKVGISTLAELVQREILSQLGERRELKIPQNEVEAAYKKQMEFLIKRFTTDTHTPDESEILERSGQKREDAVQDIYKALMVEKASEALAKDKKLAVTNDEARAYFDKYKDRFQKPGTLHLMQIYMRPGKSAANATEKEWADAEKRIKNAQDRMKVGESFEGIAKAISDGKDREKGGDMGVHPAQVFPPIYVEKARTMEIGETSAPFKSEHGWHILRLVSRESEADVPFEKARDGIKEGLLQLKTVAAVEEYCQPIMADEERVQIFLQLQVPEETTAEKR